MMYKLELLVDEQAMTMLVEVPADTSEDTAMLIAGARLSHLMDYQELALVEFVSIDSVA